MRFFATRPDMTNTVTKILALANLAFFQFAASGTALANDMMVSGAIARTSHVKQSRTGSIYLTLMNHGAKPDQLIGIKTDVAEVAELHKTENTDGVFRMRHLDQLEIPAGASVDLTKDIHVMMFGLTRDLKQDDGFQITLDFATAPDLVVDVAVGETQHLEHAPSN
jgi:periplasmic copper chaperone A